MQFKPCHVIQATNIAGVLSDEASAVLVLLSTPQRGRPPLTLLTETGQALSPRQRLYGGALLLLQLESEDASADKVHPVFEFVRAAAKHVTDKAADSYQRALVARMRRRFKFPVYPIAAYSCFMASAQAA